jgi:Flp pilus assembly protein CpaB
VRVGDRVDVLASFDASTRSARTLTVVSGAEVLGLVRSRGVFGHGDGELSALTLAVAPDDAVFLAFAARNGHLDVVRSTGGAAAARTRFDVEQLP